MFMMSSFQRNVGIIHAIQLEKIDLASGKQDIRPCWLWYMMVDINSPKDVMTCRPFPHPLQWRHNQRVGVSNHQRLFAQPFVQAQIKENTKAPRHWPLWGKFNSNTENVSIWWRHHESVASLEWQHICQIETGRLYKYLTNIWRRRVMDE